MLAHVLGHVLAPHIGAGFMGASKCARPARMEPAAPRIEAEMLQSRTAIVQLTVRNFRVWLAFQSR
jgi:hypothetical protein